MSLDAPKPHRDIPVEWSREDRTAAYFEDVELRRCSMNDSAMAGDPSIRFGVQEDEGEIRMHLRVRELEHVLEPLRQFSSHGRLPSEVRFRDYGGNYCVLRPADQPNSKCIAWGVEKGRDGRNASNSVVVLSQAHLSTLLPFLNNFVAHGSLRPHV